MDVVHPRRAASGDDPARDGDLDGIDDEQSWRVFGFFAYRLERADAVDLTLPTFERAVHAWSGGPAAKGTEGGDRGRELPDPIHGDRDAERQAAADHGGEGQPPLRIGPECMRETPAGQAVSGTAWALVLAACAVYHAGPAAARRRATRDAGCAAARRRDAGRPGTRGAPPHGGATPGERGP